MIHESIPSMPFSTALLAGLLLIPGVCAYGSPGTDAGHVIPAGKEDLFLRMTNPGPKGFPGGWTLKGVSIKVVSAVATYRGPKGSKAVIELVHPSTVGTALAKTSKFALVKGRGSHDAPDGLVKALAARIRENEAGFDWVSQVRTAAVPPDRLNTARFQLDEKQSKHLETVRKLAREGEKGPAAKAALDLARRSDGVEAAMAAALVLRKIDMPGEAARVINDTLGRLKLRRDPSALDARLELMASFDQAGSKKAVGTARELADDFPRLYPDADCARAAGLQILLREGRVKEARKAGRDLSKAGGAKKCVSLFGLKAAMAGADDDAVDKAAKTVLASFPEDEDALFLWGTYYYKKGAGRETLHKAARIWDRLARINPRYPTFIGQYGTVYLVGGLLGQDDTKRIVAEARAEPDDMVRAYLAGIGLYYQRRYHEVIPFLEKAAAAVPDDARAHMYLAMAHFFDGDPKTAEKMLEALDSAAYQEPDIYYCRSLFYRSRDLPRAIEEMEKFLQVFEGEKRLRFGQEKVEKARDDLRRMRRGEVPDVQLAIPDPLPPGQPYPEKHTGEVKKEKK